MAQVIVAETVKLYIPPKLQANIVGKGGSVIKQLQQDFDVSITIPAKDDQSEEVVVRTKTTTPPGNVDKLLIKISELIGMKVSKLPLVRAYMAIDENKYGKLIGKGGVVLKELETKSGAMIMIPKKEEGNLVRVTGTKESIVEAHKHILVALGYEVELHYDETQAKVAKIIKKIDLKRDISESLFFNCNAQEDNKSFQRFLEYLRSPMKTIDICIFTLTDDDIKFVLLELKDSGVQIRIITDDETCSQQGSDIAELSKLGAQVRMDNSPAHMHHKFAILDGCCLINGSFNWTKQAHASNRENVMITTSQKFVKDYLGEFEKLWKEFEANPLKI